MNTLEALTNETLLNKHGSLLRAKIATERMRKERLAGPDKTDSSPFEFGCLRAILEKKKSLIKSKKRHIKGPFLEKKKLRQEIKVVLLVAHLGFEVSI